MLTDKLIADLDESTFQNLTELLDDLQVKNVDLYNNTISYIHKNGLKELDLFLNTIIQMYVIVLYFDENQEIKQNKEVILYTLNKLINKDKDNIYKGIFNYYVENVSLKDFQSESVPESFYEVKEKELKEFVKLIN